MVYKSFNIQVITRIISIFVTGFVFLQIMHKPNFLYVQLLLIILTIFQIIFLIRYLNKINRKVSLFFESIKAEGYNVVYTQNESNGEFDELNYQLDQLSKHFKDVLLKREEQDEYFKAVIEHVGIGIFAFDARGAIRFVNTETLNLLGLLRLKNISSLDFIHKNLSSFLRNLQPGQQQLLELKRGNETLQLAAKVTKYKISDEELNLVSLQNIKPELDLKETETWQKMIRILTHEIMNSVSPITSLAASLSTIIKNKKETNEKIINKLYKGLTTIQNRGEGMMEFVRKYRNLTIIPLPQIAEISLKDLMTELVLLFEESFGEENINFEWSIEPEDLLLKADREQIDQVLINLIKNSIWAVKNELDKKISLKAFISTNKSIQIEIKDSGSGIEDELLDKIFIPFFTTRKEGSGIGLSLSRQIMLMHGGSISVQSDTDGGALFVLTFGVN